MVSRIVAALNQHISIRPCSALKQVFREGYGLTDLRRDISAGLVVSIVALPLTIAFAVGSGVAPEHGLYSAIVAGILTPILGGSRVQITAPTAALIVVLAPIAHDLGLGGVLLATVLGGALLMLMGALRLGTLIQFIPYPVTTGFTAGIATIIATIELRDFFGLDLDTLPAGYLEKLTAMASAAHTFHLPDLAVGLATLAVLLAWPRYVSRRVPSPLIALGLAAAAGWILEHHAGVNVRTLASQYGGIHPVPPTPIIPWEMLGPGDKPIGLSLELIEQLIPSAFAIAMLGAIASLLSAVVVDGLTGSTHDPDAELLAQGTSNIITPFFGGIAATGAVARSATSARLGARSPFAAVAQSLFILVAMLGLAPLLDRLPMAALAALLMTVAWNMAEARHIFHALRVSPGSDTTVLIVDYLLTVLLGMATSVSVGIVLAALLFMKRMADVADVKLIQERHATEHLNLPRGVLVYEIAGPLFFGAAQKAMSELRAIGSGIWLVILDMRSVPVMDATGMVNLESALDRLHKAKIKVILAGVQKQPLQLFARAHMQRVREEVHVVGNFEAAVDLAMWHAAERRATLPPAPEAPAHAP